jgi:hypothetical protein
MEMSFTKKAGTSDSVTNAETKKLNMKRRKDLNGFSRQNGAKVVSGKMSHVQRMVNEGKLEI